MFKWLSVVIALLFCRQSALADELPVAMSEKRLLLLAEKAARPLHFVKSEVDADATYSEARAAVESLLPDLRVTYDMQVKSIRWSDDVATLYATPRYRGPKRRIGERRFTRVNVVGKFDVLMSREQASNVRTGTRLRVNALLEQPATPSLPESNAEVGQHILTVKLNSFGLPSRSNQWHLYSVDYRLWHGSTELVPKWRKDGGRLKE